ncbi:hypothetical protein WR25_26472 [Diploscapter pachys]|uniref:Uncharacterized protein n=1 Tax=Diploscapter pachys TaxID=2018661 RepID=A0A2A2JDC4_9BILA|nr:hypothetical protein WR25_26472 [Diploscapter pachys]
MIRSHTTTSYGNTRMRRAVGAHVRSSRTKMSILRSTTSSGDRALAPSLRSEYVKTLLTEKYRNSVPAQEERVKQLKEKNEATAKQVHQRCELSIHCLDSIAMLSPALFTADEDIDVKRRRSMPKDESPRSGLKPSDTLGAVGSISSSRTTIDEERRIQEHRKYSSFGLDAPAHLQHCNLRKSSSSTAEEQSSRRPTGDSTSHTKIKTQPSSSSSWTHSIKERLPGFRRRVQRATEEPVTMQRSEASTQPESSNSNVKPTDNGENRENEGQQQPQQQQQQQKKISGKKINLVLPIDEGENPQFVSSSELFTNLVSMEGILPKIIVMWEYERGVAKTS